MAGAAQRFWTSCEGPCRKTAPPVEENWDSEGFEGDPEEAGEEEAGEAEMGNVEEQVD